MFKNKFLKNNLVYLTSVVLGGILGYLFHFTISRQLSVGEYGELQAIVSVSVIFGVFFSTFSLFTIKNSAVFALHKDREGQVLFFTFIKQKFRKFVLGFLVIFILLLPLIKSWLHLHDYWGILIVGFTMAISFYYSLYGNIFQGWSDFIGLGVIGVVIALIKLITGFVLATFSPSASTVILSLFISTSAGWLIASIYFRNRWPLPAESGQVNHWREKYFQDISFRKNMRQLFIFTLGMSLIGSADIIFVKSFSSAEIAGYYAALSVLGKAILAFNFSIIGVLFPGACADGYLGKPASRKSIVGSYGLILGISLPAIISFYFLGPFLVNITFGQNYQAIAPQLWLFGMMGFALSILALEAKLAVARHDFRSSGLLFLSLTILAVGIYLFHSDTRSIILAVTTSFFFGWLMMFALNVFHRVRYAKIYSVK